MWDGLPMASRPAEKQEFLFQLTILSSVFCNSLTFQSFAEITDRSAMADPRTSGYHFVLS